MIKKIYTKKRTPRGSWRTYNGKRWRLSIASPRKKNNRSTGPVSLMETAWLDSLDPILERQYPIKNFIVDGYDPLTNTVYEFLGDFWHGNPKKYNPNDIHPMRKVPFGDLYKDTIKRLKTLENLGYNIIFIWELDYIPR